MVGCQSFDWATSVAHTLGSAARPGAAASESAHWVERAQALLAPLLFAAATIMPTVSALIGTRIGWGYTIYTLIAAAVLGILATLLIRPSQKIS